MAFAVLLLYDEQHWRSHKSGASAAATVRQSHLFTWRGCNIIELARAYLVPAKTVSLPGAPGSPLNFTAGLCRIFDPRLVTIALRRDDVTVHLDERYSTHAAEWIARCGEIHPARAKVGLADGTVLIPPSYVHPDVDALKLYECGA